MEETNLPHARQALPAYYVLSSAEASSNLARYDGVRYGHRVTQYSDLDGLYVRSRSTPCRSWFIRLAANPLQDILGTALRANAVVLLICPLPCGSQDRTGLLS